ncbi:GDSL family lipase [Chitinophaga agrisoli]|uniref:GDSL family lipase n=1 Tax=Chitinophaga agrisoli TaxID=2607653 RepID=A0A5B2VWP5_9BACT|nr:GDSL-type esterase/lipase family protein [Chitinophaga agrisoli]KAA2243505.1 GDSL family lipase [Chitinophaga agrisoli]
MKNKLILFLLFSIAAGLNANAQEKPRFWDDVQTIKKYDHIYQPPVGPVLFIGSSSIRKWDDLEHDFASFNVLNRGVGGTVINDIIRYLPELVFDYKPKQIVIYVGENDLPDETVTSDTILQRTILLYRKIREHLPNVPIAYISLKPSPVREQYIAIAGAANKKLKQFFDGEQNCRFIDIFHPMLNKEGRPRPELFVKDMLHMNKEGYAIWEKAVRPVLVR